jgi:DNA repair photolyase
MNISTCSYRPIIVPCGLKNLDFQVDPYIGCEHYCYYCYALNKTEQDWTKEILIHNDIANQLSDELAKISPQKIYMGYHSDPYQPFETEYCQTRKVLELFLEKGFSASILTKSGLVVRDIDLLKEMNGASISVSVAFNDNQTRRQFEANTIDTEHRIEALYKLREAGIRTSALICPVVPYITDVIPLIDALVPVTDLIWIYGISIDKRSDRSWENVKGILKSHFPNSQGEIEDVIFSKNHPYWIRLREKLYDIQASRNLNLSIHL